MPSPNFEQGASLGASGAELGSAAGPYGAALGGALGFAVGAFGGKSADPSANDLQNELQSEQAQQFKNYQQNWAPVVNRYIQTVNNLPSTTALYQGRAAAGARSQFSNAAGQVAQNQTNQGAQVGSGRFNAAQAGVGVKEGAALGKTEQAAKEAVTDEQAAQLGNIVRIGRGQAASVLNAGSGLSAATSQQARDDARAALAARQAYAGAAGTLAGTLSSSFGPSQAGIPPPSTNAPSAYGQTPDFGGSGVDPYQGFSSNPSYALPVQGNG